MTLENIKQKILGEAETKANGILTAAEKLAAEKLAAAQKQVNAERQKIAAQLAKEREQAIQQHKQLLAMEGEQAALALKREYLQKVLEQAVEKIKRKKLSQYYKKTLKNIDLTAARILVNDRAAEADIPAEIQTEIVQQKDWPDGRLELDYGRSRLDCSLDLYARELARTLEAGLAERLWG